jgi:hypothetical protein
MEEMPLLARWRESLLRDGIPLRLDLVSVDVEPFDLTLFPRAPKEARISRVVPPSDPQAALASLGVEMDAPIPVHALVDDVGHLRCTRVGAVHEADYGSVRALLSGS